MNLYFFYYDSKTKQDEKGVKCNSQTYKGFVKKINKIKNWSSSSELPLY